MNEQPTLPAEVRASPPPMVQAHLAFVEGQIGLLRAQVGTLRAAVAKLEAQRRRRPPRSSAAPSLVPTP